MILEQLTLGEDGESADGRGFYKSILFWPELCHLLG